MRRWMLVLAAAVSVAFAGSAMAGKASKAQKAKDQLAGTISKIDVRAKEISVQPKAPKDASSDAPVLITIDEKTTIKVDGVAGQIGDLKEGMAVKVTPATGTAEKIEAKTRTATDKGPRRKGKKGGD